jgi:hypothetical protein
MCLYIDNKDPLIATRDIYVVKKLETYEYSKEYWTPFQRVTVTLNDLMLASPQTSAFPLIKEYIDLYYIGEGVIHSYLASTRLNELKNTAMYFWRKKQSPILSVFKIAYIPKGCYYWKGTAILTNNTPSVASKSLYITDINYKGVLQVKLLNLLSIIKYKIKQWLNQK